ncbi:MAG TPA: transglutaminase family protein [Roseiflexaceae bacterium]|nr:transglutaminase family protein [Roseiflexaceae bacterium]
MHYSIRHVTRFRYTVPVSESMMEIRMQPRTDAGQRCHSFTLQTIPRALILSHRDYSGNIVHHFDIPGRHSQITVTAQALVEIYPVPAIPQQLADDAWAALAQLTAGHEQLDMLLPSQFAQPTDLLRRLIHEIMPQPAADPLTTLRQLSQGIFEAFDYAPQSTTVDSPIDEALLNRRGVCQDFAHIMIAAARQLGIPCRYVSGYLFHRDEDHDRSEADATHAWVEALVPDLGWVGFDPTNNLIVGDRHIRVAIGRDYADVPPTRGVFRGSAGESLDVTVRVIPAAAPPPEEEEPPPRVWEPPIGDMIDMQQ